MTAFGARGPSLPRLTAFGMRRSIWIGALILGLVILFLGALVVTWTIPFQEWDAYSSGTWSVLISQGRPLLPPEVDRILRQRPLVYLVQGLIWRAIGYPSMRAGRLYSLLYSVLLVWATYLVSQAVGRKRSRALLAAFLVAASPLVTEQVSSTLTDIPAAALVWLGFWAVTRAVSDSERARRAIAWWIGAGILFSAALLAKVAAFPVILVLIAVGAGPSLPKMSRSRIAAALAALGIPASLVFLYFNHIRIEVSWSYFLFGWAGPFYSSLAGQHWISNLKELQWFGVFLTAALVMALASWSARSWLRRSPSREGVAAVILGLAAVYVCIGTRGLTAPLRSFESPAWDRWIAGLPEIAAVLSLGLYASRRPRPGDSRPFARYLLVPAGLFWILWWWKLGYDRRFLVIVLPAVCLFVAGWLSDLLEETWARRESAPFVCALALLAALGWEGGKKMDHGYPVFSKNIFQINMKNGLEPEAKLVDIFGDEARVMIRLREMIRAEPGLRILSPDNRLKFYLGSNATIDYAVEPEALDQFDVFVWLNNPDVLHQYAQKYHLVHPLERLREGERLSLLFSGGLYDVYRIRRRDP